MQIKRFFTNARNIGSKTKDATPTGISLGGIEMSRSAMREVSGRVDKARLVMLIRQIHLPEALINRPTSCYF